MTTLDVALRLRLKNELSGEAQKVAKDLAGIKTAAKGIEGTRGADKLKRDILDVSTASRQAGRSLQDIRREAAGLGSVRGPEKLKRDLLETASAARAAQRAIGGVKGAAAQMRDARAREVAAGQAAGPMVLGGSARLMGRLGGGFLGYRTLRAGAETVVDQDKAWAEVRKKVSASPEELAQLQVQLREIARKYGLSISETFSQAAEAGAGGIDKADIGKFVELTTRASVGWDTTARETAQRLTEIKAGVKATLPMMEDLANKINALGDNSAAKERDIVEMFHRSGAAAKKAGVSFDDTLAILTAVRSTGMQEEVASRWFNAFTWELAGAHAKDKKKKEAWKELGFEPLDIAKGMKSDASGTIVKVLEAFNKLEQLQRIKIGSALFGQGWQDEFARAAEAIDEIKKQLVFIRNPKNWQGSLDTNLKIQQETIANRWERVKAAASDMADEIDRATRASKLFNATVDALLDKYEQSKKWRREEGERIAKAEEEVQRRGEAPGAEEDRYGPAVERQAIERRLAARRRALAAAEADVARGAPSTWQGRGRPAPGMQPADVARLRQEVADMDLRMRALEPRPPLDLSRPPEDRPAASPSLPHKPKRLPVALPPVQGFGDEAPLRTLDEMKRKASDAGQALDQLGHKTVAPTVETGGLDQAIQKLGTIQSLLQRIGSMSVSPKVTPQVGQTAAVNSRQLGRLGDSTGALFDRA